MIRSFIAAAMFATWLYQPVSGQENIKLNEKSKRILSPEVHADNTVTFRFFAPQAKQVSLLGNWMDRDATGKGGRQPMHKDGNYWSYTSTALPSDLFLYNIDVDGATINDPLNVYQVRDVSNTFNYFLTGGDQSALYQVQDVPHGTLSKLWYASKTLNMTRRMTVYTPPGYEEGKINYPVLYLLHGMGGDEDAWPTLGRVSEILDNLIAANKIKPMLVVMPNGHVSNTAAPGESSKGQYPIEFFTPDVGSGKMEESFQDIVNFVESHYRVKKSKASRALAGLSMGGSHTLFISAHMANTFDYVGLFSAAFRMGEKTKSPVYENFDNNLVKQRDQGYKLYWIGMGKDDFLYKTGEQYRKKLDDIGMKYTYRESEGGHTWTNWRMYLTEFLPLLF